MAVTTTTFEVRLATAADADKLAGLWREVMRDLASLDRRLRLADDAETRWREELVDWLGREDMRIVVADRQGQLIGFAIGCIVARPPIVLPERIGLISELEVDGHARQAAVGSALFEALQGWFRDQAIEVVEVQVRTRHPIAQAFWRAAGAADYVDHLRLKLRFE